MRVRSDGDVRGAKEGRHPDVQGAVDQRARKPLVPSRQARGDEDVGGGVEDVNEGGLGDHGGEDVGPVVWGDGHEGEEEGGGEGAGGGEDEEDAAGDEVQDCAGDAGADDAGYGPGGVPEGGGKGGDVEDELDAGGR